MKFNITLFVLLLTCSFLQCQVASNDKALAIDSLLQACHEQHIFNGVALVADQGKVIVHNAYGVSDLDAQTPLKLSDRFYIGSLTKQFTSVLIFRLQEDGLIDIHAPLSNYLSEFGDSIFAAITLHQMLTHTSGLGSFTSHPDFDKSVVYSEQEMFAFIQHPLHFPPGTDWSYSNSGYYLLGKIAERVSGKDYGALLQEHIFGPLGMKNTAYTPIWLKADLAKGNVRSVNGMIPMPRYALQTLFSTGGMYSTAADLFSWALALDGNALLTDTSKEVLFQPVHNDYACGIFVKRGTNGFGEPYERHFHGGMIQGYHSFLFRRLPQGQVIILLDNCYNQELQTIKNRIWSALVEEHIRPVKPMLSVLLFEAAYERKLAQALAAVSGNSTSYEERYDFDEFDINKVAYRLMEAERYREAEELFAFNIERYPNSWNVYDSMGELLVLAGKFEEAQSFYEQSLLLNPENTSASKALKIIKKKKGSK